MTSANQNSCNLVRNLVLAACLLTGAVAAAPVAAAWEEEPYAADLPEVDCKYGVYYSSGSGADVRVSCH